MPSRILFLCLASLMAVGTFGCGGATQSGNGGGGFNDRLTFGTAIGGNGFALVGEGTTFSLTSTTGTIWFKVESSRDIGSQTIRLYVNDGTYSTEDFTVSQASSHFLLSSIRITDTGTYKVKAYMVQAVGPDIGKETLIGGANIDMPS
jgi:hypothetical protein